MKTSKHSAYSQTNATWVVVITGAILLVPLLAMQFSDQVNWNVADFIAAGALLLGVGFAYMFIVKKARNTRQRLIFAGALVAIFLLIWIEMAVGIFGTPLSGS